MTVSTVRSQEKTAAARHPLAPLTVAEAGTAARAALDASGPVVDTDIVVWRTVGVTRRRRAAIATGSAGPSPVHLSRAGMTRPDS